MALLTIDDVPSSRFTAKLDWLGGQGIRAVLFVWGELVSGHEAELLAALAAGHLLANHAWSHRGFSTLSIGEARQEIEQTDQLLAGLYALAGRPWQLKLFRFPYIDRGRDKAQQAELQALLTSLGYEALPGHRDGWVDIGVDFDQMEYWLGNAQAPDGLSQEEAILARIGPGKPAESDVILIHDHDYSHELFFECIQRYQKIGVGFGGIPQWKI